MPLGDRQTEARAPEPGTLLVLLEGGENGLAAILTDALAGVDDVEAVAVLGLLRHQELDGPAIGELHGVCQQVDQHLAQLVLVAAHPQGRAPSLHPPMQALLGAAPLEHGRHSLYQSGEVEVGGCQLLVSGLDPRQVEDVVDQGQEVGAAALNGLDGPALLRRQLALVLQELRVAQDGVHGRADLVTHVGQEEALGLVGLLGRVPGLLQLEVVLLEDSARLLLLGQHLLPELLCLAAVVVVAPAGLDGEGHQAGEAAAEEQDDPGPAIPGDDDPH